jgi:hypothetical protein
MYWNLPNGRCPVIDTGHEEIRAILERKNYV